ncbi:MAG: hypothetical protein HYW48_00455 [Deltaproteobacteria bacterium]|nr:hypothetical protein [Deltaproteobacteria bacterium]
MGQGRKIQCFLRKAFFGGTICEVSPEPLLAIVMRKPLGANRERGVWGGEGTVAPPSDFLEEPAAQFPPNHLLAPSGLRITCHHLLR